MPLTSREHCRFPPPPRDREQLVRELPPQSPPTAEDRIAGARDFADMSPEEQKKVVDGLEELRTQEAEYRRIDTENKAFQKAVEAERVKRDDPWWQPPVDWQPTKTEIPS